MSDTPDTSTPFARAGLNDCWNKIGVRGDGSCPELKQHAHCRNCPVYASVAAETESPLAKQAAERLAELK